MSDDVNVVDARAFQSLMAVRAGTLLALADQLRRPGVQEKSALRRILTRPFLSLVLGQSAQLAELMDAYGAYNNSTWAVVRCHVAALKVFSGIHYQLLHLYHTSPSYRLLPVEGDFRGDTEAMADVTGGVIRKIACNLLAEAEKRNLPVPATTHSAEALPPGKLPRDQSSRSVSSAKETVVRLATAFLNLSEDHEKLDAWIGRGRVMEGKGPANVPAEADVRQLEDRFHTLQALYDTFVSNTDVENLDELLPTLRGHISVIFHLLELTTGLAHYYERHMAWIPVAMPKSPEKDAQEPVPTIAADDLLRVVRTYSVHYALLYLKAGRDLCQRMLKQYAEIGEVVVPVPRYRGFHVRPSTLVSKIVLHYGSPVTMRLDGETYDASSPLELFRANEKINARKRRWLAAETSALLNQLDSQIEHHVMRVVRRIAMTLAEQSKVIIYEYPLPSSSPLEKEEPPGANFVIDELIRLQSMGKIDIDAQLEVTFRGDKRVLNDLQLLAREGYGEDHFGNNIALPPELSYLRR